MVHPPLAAKSGFSKSMGFREATNFQFLKILALLGQLLVGACLPQTLLGDFILGGCYIAYMPFQILICYI